MESLVAGRAGSACALAADVCGSGAPHLRFEQAQHDMGEDRGYTDLYADDGARHGEERALARRMDEIERKLRPAGLRAEGTELYRVARSRKLSDETARKLVREVDLLQARFGTR